VEARHFGARERFSGIEQGGEIDFSTRTRQKRKNCGGGGGGGGGQESVQSPERAKGYCG